MPRVLLVDDDIAEISAVKRVLARAGHQALLATSASDALGTIGRTPPAVLVVAATCEGGAALRRIAGDGAGGALPLVVLGETPDAPPGAVQVARPVDPGQLAEQLAAALRAAPPPAAPPPPAQPVARVPVSRRAAADALRARAEELRRGAVTSALPAAAARPAASPIAQAPPAAAPPAAPRRADAQADAPAPAAAAPAPFPDADAALAELEAPARGPGGAALDLEQDPGLEALLRRAEEAEARARSEEAARRAEAEATARAAAEEEARRAEEHRRRAEEEARRAAEAEARARSEREARETADRELQRLRQELEQARRAAEDQARAVAEAARAEEEEGRRRVDADEEQLRAAIQSARAEMEALRQRSGAEEEQLRAAIQSARAEMEALRRRGEEEARRRAQAEAEAARLAKDAEEARAALEAERHGLEAPAPEPPRAAPVADPAQEAARRRVAALRERGAAVTASAAPPPQAAEEPPRAPVRAPPAELRSGTLADLPAPRLLALAARAALGGRLDLDGAASRSLYFEGGRVVGATSSSPGERLEEVALRLGLLTRDQHRIVAASAAPLATRRAAVLLLERGFLKPEELAPLVRRRTEEVVFGAFGDVGARFRWSAAEVPPDESTALERTALQLAVEGVRRRWLAPELERVLGGDATLLAPAGDGAPAADLGLSPEDRRVLALADGLRTLDELVAASPLDALSTRQLLAALVLVGALAVRTFQAGRPAAAASAAIDLARVREKLEQVRRADYFTVLGVGRLCTPHEVRDAHERLRAEFDPRRFAGVREEGLEERLEEILRVVGDARDVLADDFLRAEYLRGLGE